MNIFAYVECGVQAGQTQSLAQKHGHLLEVQNIKTIIMGRNRFLIKYTLSVLKQDLRPQSTWMLSHIATAQRLFGD